MSRGCASKGIDGHHRPRGGEHRRRPGGGRLLRREGRQSGTRRSARDATCRSCGAPRCWPSSCASSPAWRSAARMARRRRHLWSRHCSMPAASIRPSSTAASSTPMAPMRGWARATGWWSNSMIPMAPSSSFRPTSSIVTNIDPEHLDHYGTFDKAKEAFLAFVENIPFLWFRGDVHRSPGGAGADRRGARTAASSPMAAARRPMSADRRRAMTDGETRFSVRMPDRRRATRMTSRI